MRGELEAPCAPKEEIRDNCCVIHVIRVKISMAPESTWILSVVPFEKRREEAEVPVFGDVPIERIERVQEHEEHPNND